MNGMKYLLAVACALTVIAAQAKDKEEMEKEIALKDAPAEIQTAVNTLIGLLPEGSKLDKLTEEQEGEAIVYDAEIELPDGGECEVEFNAWGKIMEIEIEKDKGKNGDSDEDEDEGEDGAEEDMD